MPRPKPRAGAVHAAPATSTSVGIVTPVYGCNSETGKVAQGILDALVSAGVPAGVVGHPEPTGYSEPTAAPENYAATVSLAAPWAWRFEPARPLIGIVAATVASASPSWGNALRFARRVFAPSQWAVDAIGQQTRLMRFGVDRAFSYQPKRLGEKFRMLFVAEDATDPREGLDIALGAFRKSFEDRDGVELVIRSLNRSLDKDDVRVRFAFGNMTPAQMANLYRSADVLVYSARAASFGMAALEALACGTPVIHSGKTGMADFADLGLPTLSRPIPGPDGQWHEPYSDEIAVQLRSLATDRDAIAQKARADAQAVDHRFRWNLDPLLRAL